QLKKAAEELVPLLNDLKTEKLVDETKVKNGAAIVSNISKAAKYLFIFSTGTFTFTSSIGNNLLFSKKEPLLSELYQTAEILGKNLSKNGKINITDFAKPSRDGLVKEMMWSNLIDLFEKRLSRSQDKLADLETEITQIKAQLDSISATKVFSDKEIIASSAVKIEDDIRSYYSQKKFFPSFALAVDIKTGVVSLFNTNYQLPKKAIEEYASLDKERKIEKLEIEVDLKENIKSEEVFIAEILLALHHPKLFNFTSEDTGCLTITINDYSRLSKLTLGDISRKTPLDSISNRYLLARAEYKKEWLSQLKKAAEELVPLLNDLKTEKLVDETKVKNGAAIVSNISKAVKYLFIFSTGTFTFSFTENDLLFSHKQPFLNNLYQNAKILGKNLSKKEKINIAVYEELADLFKESIKRSKGELTDLEKRIARIEGQLSVTDVTRRFSNKEITASSALVIPQAGATLVSAVEEAENNLSEDVTEQNLPFIIQVNKDGNFVAPISPKDTIMIGHVRGDRVAYLAKRFFERGFKNLIGYIKFAKDFIGISLLFEQVTSQVPNTFFEILNNKGYKVVKISEDEKKDHVGDNANGRGKTPFSNERRVVIPMQKSNKAYVDTPQMKMKECGDEVIKELEGDANFILVNFLGSDMMKHTGNFEAAKTSNEITDEQIGRIKKKVDSIKNDTLLKIRVAIIAATKPSENELPLLLYQNYLLGNNREFFLNTLRNTSQELYNKIKELEAKVPLLIITADHGASEDGLKANPKESDTFHTANPVPYIIYDPLTREKVTLKSGKTIVNNAATLLHLLGKKIPPEYAESLLPDTYQGSKRRVVFTVLDGWGINPDQKYPYDAIRLANTPNYDWLISNASFTKLMAHGEVIGLRKQLSYEEGVHHLRGLQPGQTDIGHLSLFSGQKIKQPLLCVDNLITKEIREGIFDKNKPELKELINSLIKVKKDPSSKFVYVTIGSEGGVHSSLYHLYALMRLAKKIGLEKDQLVIIFAADGRDVPSRTAHLYLQEVLAKAEEIGIGIVSCVFGRDMLVRKDSAEHITNRIIDVISGVNPEGDDVKKVSAPSAMSNHQMSSSAMVNDDTTGGIDGSTSLTINPNKEYGGIDMQGINVAASPASSSINMPLPSFDVRNLEGLSFTVQIGVLNLNTFFGLVSGEKEEKLNKLACLKN
ncbi:MAG: hypothetical protein QMD94_03770, partial [Candidatus Omnitrophota bacterium]|nr:hypothetical protein [Candidatus Omnitrophota bacterium]